MNAYPVITLGVVVKALDHLFVILLGAFHIFNILYCGHYLRLGDTRRVFRVMRIDIFGFRLRPFIRKPAVPHKTLRVIFLQTAPVFRQIAHSVVGSAALRAHHYISILRKGCSAYRAKLICKF